MTYPHHDDDFDPDAPPSKSQRKRDMHALQDLGAQLVDLSVERLRKVPVLLDGFVASAAAAPLRGLDGDGLAHALAGHVSAEAGHRRLLRHMGLDPILDLGMRLGEASGACLAVNVLRSALACHGGMATFAQAGVSEG